jgi:hypothetical protein
MQSRAELHWPLNGAEKWDSWKKNLSAQLITIPDLLWMAKRAQDATKTPKVS